MCIFLIYFLYIDNLKKLNSQQPWKQINKTKNKQTNVDCKDDAVQTAYCVCARGESCARLVGCARPRPWLLNVSLSHRTKAAVELLTRRCLLTRRLRALMAQLPARGRLCLRTPPPLPSIPLPPTPKKVHLNKSLHGGFRSLNAWL